MDLDIVDLLQTPCDRDIELDSRTPRSPLLSVIIPAYNTAEYITETIRSVSAALPVEDYEVIVVNDGSTDLTVKTTKDIISELGLHALVLSQTNQGLGAARNQGLRFARAQYVMFVDSDDLFNGSTMCQMLATATEFQSEIVIASAACFDAQTFEIFSFPDSDVFGAIMNGGAIYHTNYVRTPELLRLEPSVCTKLFARDLLSQRQEMFPVALLFEDLPAWISTVTRAKRVSLLATTGLYYRVGRPGQITSVRSDRRFDMLTVAKFAFDELVASCRTVEAAANASGMVARMLYWCGKYVLNDRKAEYYRKACEVYAVFPSEWIHCFVTQYALDDRERLIVESLRNGDWRMLQMFASGGRCLSTLMRAVARPKSKVVRKLARIRIAGRFSGKRPV